MPRQPSKTAPPHRPSSAAADMAGDSTRRALPITVMRMQGKRLFPRCEIPAAIPPAPSRRAAAVRSAKTGPDAATPDPAPRRPDGRDPAAIPQQSMRRRRPGAKLIVRASPGNTRSPLRRPRPDGDPGLGKQRLGAAIFGKDAGAGRQFVKAALFADDAILQHDDMVA